MPKRTRQVASHVDVIRIHEELKKVCRKEGDYAFYAEGHDDETIAKLVDVGTSSVANIRRQFFGRVRTETPVQAMRKELDELLLHSRQQEQMINLLAQEMRDVIERYNKLVMAIALNRSSTPPDVKHLQVPLKQLHPSQAVQ